MSSDFSLSDYKQSLITNRCKKCILPDSYPRITFDEDNICSKCRGHDKFHISPLDYEKLEKKLEIILNGIKSRKNEYDCVIGLSGGKDSSYMTYLCVEKYDLNPLCVTFDNGFLSEHAVENIQKIVKKLDLAHLTCKHDWKTMKTLYRNFLLETGEICTPCNISINSFLYKAALENNITTIISGYSASTDAESNINIYHSSP
jgi:tRNA(Ile)-lysidine synthase TilS/MesJ